MYRTKNLKVELSIDYTESTVIGEKTLKNREIDVQRVLILEEKMNTFTNGKDNLTCKVVLSGFSLSRIKYDGTYCRMEVVPF